MFNLSRTTRSLRRPAVQSGKRPSIRSAARVAVPRHRRAFFEPLEDRRVMASATLSGVGRSWQIVDTAISDDGTSTGFVGDFAGNPTGAAGSGPAIYDATLSALQDAFDFGAMVWVNNNRLNGALSGGGQFANFAPETVSGLQRQMSYMADQIHGTFRTLVTLTNTTGASINANVEYVTEWGWGAETTIANSSNGNTSFTAADRWIVTAQDGASSRPVHTTVFSGPGASSPLASTNTVVGPGFDGAYGSLSVSVPAGATRSVMFFHHLTSTTAAANSFVSTFDTSSLPVSFLDGMDDASISSVRNWNTLTPAYDTYAYIDSSGNLIVNDAQSTTDDAITLRRVGGLVEVDAGTQVLRLGPGGTRTSAGVVRFPVSSITGQIVVNAGGGNDVVQLDATLSTVTSDIVVNGGAGTDNVDVGAGVRLTGNADHSAVVSLLGTNSKLDVAATTTISGLNGPSGSYVELSGSLNVEGSGLFNGEISGPHTLIKAGSGTLELGGHNTHRNTEVYGGILRVVSAANVLPDKDVDNNPVLIVRSGGTLDLNGFDEQIGDLATESGSTVALGTGSLTVYATGIYSGYGEFVGTADSSLNVESVSEFQLGAASPNFDGTFNLTGGAVAWNPEAFGSTLGGVNVTNGTLVLGAGIATFYDALSLDNSAVRGYSTAHTWAGPIHLESNSQLYSDTWAPELLLTITGEISGPGGLTTSGQVVLANGGNSYLGPTYANGTLTLAAMGATPAGSTVTVGGRLTGGGSALGSVGVYGTISPGVGAGVLGTGNLSFANQWSTYSAEVNSASPGGHDVVEVAGSVDLNGMLSLSGLYEANVNVPEELVIIANDGTDPVVGTFAGLPEGASIAAPGGGTLYVFYRGGDGNDVSLRTVPVPVITSPDSVSVAEGATIATTVTASYGELSAEAVSFSITGGDDAGLFTIDSETGVVTFVQPPDFEQPDDANTDRVYQLTIEASDGEISTSQNLSITVLPVNEHAPVILSSGVATIAENTSAVLTVDASDADLPAETLQYSLSGTDAVLFTINSSGQLSFVAAPDYEVPTDSGLNNVYNLTVSVSDGQFSAVQQVVVTVTPVNDNPTAIVAPPEYSVPENSLLAFTYAYVDADLGQSISGTTWLTGPDAALFTYASSNRILFLTAPDYENPADADGDNVYQIVMNIVDSQFSSSQAFTITVTEVNEFAPLISTAGTASVAENETAVIDVNATDADLPAATLEYSISGGVDGDLFAIDSTTGVVTFITAPDYENPADADGDNVYDLQVSVSDGGLTTVQSIAVTVTPVNEHQPVFVTPQWNYVPENSTLAVDVDATDDDLPAVALVYEIIGGQDGHLFTIDSSTGVLTFLSPPDFESPADVGGDNIYEVQVTVSDGALLDTWGDTLTFIIEVTDVGELDFGDAPDSYGTLLAADGARHVAATLRLGATAETDADGQPGVAANGDDTNGVDDEDGVTLPSSLVARVGATIVVSASQAGLLDAWIDYNRNGQFDPAEQIASSLPVVAGNNSLTIDVPAGVVAGASYARFRLSSAGGLGPTGAAADGEVEDYAVQLAQPALGSIAVVADPLNPGQNMLVVRGTNATDSIVVQPLYYPAGQVQVMIAGKQVVNVPLASFARIVIFGEGGADAINVSPTITTPAYLYGDEGSDSLSAGGGDDYLYGGNGDDTLLGNGGHDVLLGEAGIDSLFGSAGRDTLIGGAGQDWLYGQEDDDLLIGSLGPTSYASLQAIQALWVAPQSLAQRAAALSPHLNSSTVLDDGVIDYLYGFGGSDWQLDFQLRDMFLDYLATQDRKN